MSVSRLPVKADNDRASFATENCADAVRLLLNFKESKQKGARPGAPDDAEGLKNARTDTEIIPR